MNVESPPFRAGDEVMLAMNGELAIVKQCFDGVGGWRVLAQVKGRERTRNKGMIDFPASALARSSEDE